MSGRLVAGVGALLLCAGPVRAEWGDRGTLMLSGGVPIALHVSWVFVSFGPIAFVPFSGPKDYDLGLRTLIGAWF